MQPKLILASQSARRKKLLTSLGLSYKCMVPQMPETFHKKKPSAITKELAYNKAKEIAQTFTKGIILAADTIVVCNGEIIGKPKNPSDSKRILHMLTRSIQYVYTGIAIIDLYKGKRYCDYEKTTVQMKRISLKEIDHLAKKHRDKAGGYAIQEDGDTLVKYIKGDYFNVVGLPLKKTIRILKKCGIHISASLVKKQYSRIKP